MSFAQVLGNFIQEYFHPKENKKDNSSDYRTVVRISGDNNGRVGINNTNPQYTLDINGDLKSSGDIEGDNIISNGNLEVSGKINVNGDVEFTSSTGGIKDVGNIEPRGATYDLGSETNPWERIFVTKIGS